jgi:hypothetical protein
MAEVNIKINNKPLKKAQRTKLAKVEKLKDKLGGDLNIRSLLLYVDSLERRLESLEKKLKEKGVI